MFDNFWDKPQERNSRAQKQRGASHDGLQGLSGSHFITHDYAAENRVATVMNLARTFDLMSMWLGCHVLQNLHGLYIVQVMLNELVHHIRSSSSERSSQCDGPTASRNIRVE